MIKKIIFGAGIIGKMAIMRYPDVAYLIDNNSELWGKKIQGIEVKPVNAIKNENGEYEVIIASKHKASMEQQLKELEVKNYSIYEYLDKFFYSTPTLIYNPYEDNENRDVTEQEWNQMQILNEARNLINHEVEKLFHVSKLFTYIEIETINRCNGSCGFCPVNKHRDTREYMEMSQELFEKIIDELASIEYTGRICLYSNNEPFLDKHIIEKHKYMFEKLPKAQKFLFTNGTLLKLEWFIEIVNYLDELIIDNYHQELKLIKPCEEIQKYCEVHPELKEKVTIVLRKPQEILTSRGGDAPNRTEIVSFPKDRCVLPFKQMVIRPDGKVSLCCNDPLGKNTLGDVSKESLMEVWNNDRFKMVRKCLYDGRENWEHCRYCDVFNIG